MGGHLKETELQLGGREGNGENCMKGKWIKRQRERDRQKKCEVDN
jgi:hypothetical protein